ncbi:2-C-methyl-D-erythritol 4-phosphate cytidylyltransferase [Halomicronema hongdechloris C2206]|uniref:2-C-methyl-D-erythritol 4-phosphate cytidylyltransferase n=1 Tax=Halomicronema hongdechloris C2206 TaxID=1641165 RepID=A0A1Z3HHH2_9CYAN|nr:2-C-methyl-D-erythritol 4-phosphate cytidylyltransferase [Halomicronema hongdechloris]ASC69713.1 2-C-methyl-D-erythritol 4-phosphate cytidylyltransferase [Halomicronema hongdechloris C2206]
MHLLIPAAGMGRRMGADRNKVLLTVRGRPLIAWTLLAAEAAQRITWIGLIGQPVDQALLLEIFDSLGLTTPVHFIAGGDTRQASVYNGLQALPEEATRVLIHDGARCLISPDLFDRCAAALENCSGLIAAVPVKDTIKQVDRDLKIENTPDRRCLWAAQTPQGFDVALLKSCHSKGQQLQWMVTDDAALFENCGLPVQVIPGEETNVKVTTPSDLAIAEWILSQRSH